MGRIHDHGRDQGEDILQVVPTDGVLLLGIELGVATDPDAFPPDIHIFTSSKQPWVVLPADTPAVPEFYDLESFWPADSLERRRLLQGPAPR